MTHFDKLAVRRANHEPWTMNLVTQGIIAADSIYYGALRIDLQLFLIYLSHSYA